MKQSLRRREDRPSTPGPMRPRRLAAVEIPRGSSTHSRSWRRREITTSSISLRGPNENKMVILLLESIAEYLRERTEPKLKLKISSQDQLSPPRILKFKRGSFLIGEVPNHSQSSRHFPAYVYRTTSHSVAANLADKLPFLRRDLSFARHQVHTLHHLQLP